MVDYRGLSPKAILVRSRRDRRFSGSVKLPLKRQQQLLNLLQPCARLDFYQAREFAGLDSVIVVSREHQPVLRTVMPEAPFQLTFREKSLK
jgi:hypothetical protein